MKRIFLYTVLLLLACNTSQKIKDGAMAFDLKQYAVAIDMLKEEYSEDKRDLRNGDKAFLIGRAFDALDKPAEAAVWYQKAIEYEYGPKAMLSYAGALKKLEKYGEAEKIYNLLKTEVSLDRLLDQEAPADDWRHR